MRRKDFFTSMRMVSKKDGEMVVYLPDFKVLLN